MRRRGGQTGGDGASGISLKVRAKLNLQVQMWHVCCLGDAYAIYIYMNKIWLVKGPQACRE